MQKYKESKTEISAARNKKHDDLMSALRELICNGNRQCFDCSQKGPTYVNMTIGSFVCTRCSGILRGLTPPHRVKSISVATFTKEEINFLKEHGNDECAKTWLGLWDPKRTMHQDQRELMIDKYERKRYYLEPGSPLKSLTNVVPLKLSKSSTNGLLKLESRRNGQSKESVGSRKSEPIENLLALDAFKPTAEQYGKSVLENNNKDEKLQPTFIDFVADFNSANIFNSATLTAANSMQKLSAAGQMVINSNGYAKIRPAKEVQSLTATNGNIVTENFADFENAPIYNAATQLSNETMVQNGNAGKEDKYAALKDLDQQLRESLATTSIGADSITNGNARYVNPFKNSFAQNDVALNPFKASTIATHGQTTFSSNFLKTNEFAQNHFHQQSESQLLFNFNNGYIHNDFSANQIMNITTNSCGLGSGNLKIPKSSTVNGLNNPFMTTNTLNGNNPFL